MPNNGEGVQHTVMVFVDQMLVHFGEEGFLGAVERDSPVKVVSSRDNPEALLIEFGEEPVAGARVARKTLIKQISYPTILNLILAVDSPSKGWCTFEKFYAPPAAAD